MRRSSRRQRCRSVEPRERIRDEPPPRSIRSKRVCSTSATSMPDRRTDQLSCSLHGWPYDVQSYAEAHPDPRGGRPPGRGPIPARLWLDAVPRREDTPRNGEQAALAVDVVALMDALKIERAVIAGFDWGARSAGIVAALWPERAKALVLVSGYLIGSVQANRIPLPPRAELAWWYQFYLRDRARPPRLRREHRWRSIGSSGRQPPRAGRSTTTRSIGPRPRSTTPITPTSSSTTTAGGSGSPTGNAVQGPRGAARGRAGHRRPDDHDGRRCQRRAPPGARAYRTKFSGPYEHRLVEGGVGHNLPQEAPEAFARAVIDVDRF